PSAAPSGGGVGFALLGWPAIKTSFRSAPKLAASLPGAEACTLPPRLVPAQSAPGFGSIPMSANFDERLAPRPAETSPPEAGAEHSTATADERSARALLAQADVVLHERTADAPEDFAVPLL